MKIIRLKPFLEDYKELPLDIQNRADKQIRFLVDNPNHPSLRIKKLQGSRNIWEVRVTRRYRITFCIEEDRIILRRIGTHDSPFVVHTSQ